MLRSLTARLLLAVGIISGSFLSLTGYLLNNAYEESVLAATEARMQNHVFTLIAIAEFGTHELIEIPLVMPSARFNQLDAGLYARIVRNDGAEAWRSLSMQNLDIGPANIVDETQSRFYRVKDNKGKELFVYDFGVSWDQDTDKETYTVSVMENVDDFNDTIARFRKRVEIALGSVAVVLLMVLAGITQWSLAPVRRAAQEIKKIEDGQQTVLHGHYPTELVGLTKNINGLILSSQARLDRYRNSSADLAHSLKTPLALLQSASEVEADNKELRRIVSEQVSRMSQIVSYQLQRAATTGQVPLSRPVVLKPLLQKITSSLDKVYREKQIKANCLVDANVTIFGDESDIMEVFGNLLDNAYKWAKHRVSISAVNASERGEHRRLVVNIEDDGPGIDPSLAARVIERGIRSDGQSGGTGIGLAVVSDIVNAYNASLEIGASELGGARFSVVFNQY